MRHHLSRYTSPAMLVGLILTIGALAGCSVTGGSSKTPGAAITAISERSTPAATSAAASTSTASASQPTAQVAEAAASTAAGATAPAASSTQVAAAAASATPAATTSPDLSTQVRAVVQQVKPAVVQITNLDVQLEQFDKPVSVSTGVGTGVIYDSSGLILTNNHVVEGASKLQVTLVDNRTFPAKLVGADPQTDLAVVKIDGDNLPVAQLGDSGQLQVGDWVVAIGNALALPGGPTVTAGVVAALGRTVQAPGEGNSPGPYLYDLIQTDAAINPGNSGGPLLNLAGQVVGLNTLGSTSAENLGFAISMKTVKPLADEIVKNGKVDHAYLGVATTMLTPALKVQLGVNASQGAVVVSVDPTSPAEQAGLQRADVIAAIDGAPIKAEPDLPLAIDSHKPGDTVTLTIDRGGKQMDVKVTLGSKPTS